MDSSNDKPPGFDVGYGKPPRHSRFQKGQSGNPGGRPSGMTQGRATNLALKQAFRRVTVREGGKVFRITVFEAVVRSQAACAIKGNGTAQRAFLEMIRLFEAADATQAAANQAPADTGPDVTKLTALQAARRIAFALEKAKRILDERRAAEGTRSPPTSGLT